MLVISNGRTISEKMDWKGSGRGLILLRRLPEETENAIDFRENTRFSTQYFNLGPSEYEAGVLTTRQRLSIFPADI